jgi:glyoxylase-like metal-dependent hydrolase (beta-lactamase superfamily II)
MPAVFRAITRYERGQPAAQTLRAAGYDLRALRGILLTHAHWDHVSGVPDFPGTPLLVPQAERQYVQSGDVRAALARSLGAARYQPYEFEDGPYLGFAHSHDVYGDGAIVSVPAPGHTPGSVIVFVNLPNGRRYAFVGDLVWQLEGIQQREERPWLQRLMVDLDSQGVRHALLQMAAIARRFPELIIIPAHDQRGFAGLPRLR